MGMCTTCSKIWIDASQNTLMADKICPVLVCKQTSENNIYSTDILSCTPSISKLLTRGGFKIVKYPYCSSFKRTILSLCLSTMHYLLLIVYATKEQILTDFCVTRTLPKNVGLNISLETINFCKTFKNCCNARDNELWKAVF